MTKILIDKETVELALEVLKKYSTYEGATAMADKAIDALYQALEQSTEQDPVAWMDSDGNVSDNNDHKCFPIPLYTQPQEAAPRQWVGLTDDEIMYMYNEPRSDAEMIAFGREIEAKLKEKNSIKE